MSNTESPSGFPKPIPPVLFRYLDEKFADDFVKGVVRVSTLETFRQYEDVERGDSGEGTITRRVGIAMLNGDNFNDRLRAQSLLGGAFGFGGQTTIINGRFTSVIHDAYALSFTEFDDPSSMQGLGKATVRISYPVEFAKLLTQMLERQGVPVSQTLFGPVLYRGREFDEGYEEPGVHLHPAFLKPVDGYTHQQEWRIVWTIPVGLSIKPFNVSCPAARRLLYRVR